MNIATIDNFFNWAVQQPLENTPSIQFTMTTNELTRNNLVSYSEGRLFYHRARSGVSFFFPAFFQGDAIQYFNNNRDGGAPFNNQTNPLTVTLSAGLPSDPRYAIVIKAPAWNAQFDLVPQMDAATGVLTATLGNSLLTISLCDSISTPPDTGPK